VIDARQHVPHTVALAAIGLVVAVVSTACGVLVSRPADPAGIHAIKHVVMIMQENRSFDS
jgi:phospholipase C